MVLTSWLTPSTEMVTVLFIDATVPPATARTQTRAAAPISTGLRQPCHAGFGRRAGRPSSSIAEIGAASAFGGDLAMGAGGIVDVRGVIRSPRTIRPYSWVYSALPVSVPSRSRTSPGSACRPATAPRWRADRWLTSRHVRTSSRPGRGERMRAGRAAGHRCQGTKKQGLSPTSPIDNPIRPRRRQVLPQSHPRLPHPGCYHGRVTVRARTGNQRDGQGTVRLVRVGETPDAPGRAGTINRANRTHCVRGQASTLSAQLDRGPATETAASASHGA